MIEGFFDDKPWFSAKRFGYGAGWPIAPQGWAVMALYFLALGGIGMISDSPVGAVRIGAFALFVMATAWFLVIVHRRTEGGWKWRWGRRQDD